MTSGRRWPGYGHTVIGRLYRFDPVGEQWEWIVQYAVAVAYRSYPRTLYSFGGRLFTLMAQIDAGINCLWTWGDPPGSDSLSHFRAFTGRPHVFYVKAADGNLWERIYDTET